MADVKLKKYGLKDIIYFTNKPKEREKRIQASSAAKTSATFKCNEKAAERHPNEQEFIIEKIVERGEGVCSYTLRRKDGENPAFFRAGQYVVIRQSIDGKLIARPVSISSGPEETLSGTMEVTVKQVPDGFLSKYIIANWHVGGEVKTSGPQGMYGFLDKEIESLGLDQRHYRKELFGSIKQPWTLPGYPQEAKNKVFTLKVKMCNKDYEIPCRADENMLVALERAGIAGPNRCRGGVCGWCRSRLVSGEVSIPETTDGRRQADKHYGYIHPCASFALSDVSIEVPNNK